MTERVVPFGLALSEVLPYRIAGRVISFERQLIDGLTSEARCSFRAALDRLDALSASGREVG